MVRKGDGEVSKCHLASGTVCTPLCPSFKKGHESQKNWGWKNSDDVRWIWVWERQEGASCLALCADCETRETSRCLPAEMLYAHHPHPKLSATERGRCEHTANLWQHWFIFFVWLEHVWIKLCLCAISYVTLWDENTIILWRNLTVQDCASCQKTQTAKYTQIWHFQKLL